MNSLTFDKLRSNKALALNESVRDADGHFTELFTVILEDDGTMTFQFSQSILIEPVAGNCINIHSYK